MASLNDGNSATSSSAILNLFSMLGNAFSSSSPDLITIIQADMRRYYTVIAVAIATAAPADINNFLFVFDIIAVVGIFNFLEIFLLLCHYYSHFYVVIRFCPND